MTLIGSETGSDRTSVFTELAFGDVDLCGSVVGGRAVDCIELFVVGVVLDFKLAADVALIRLFVAVKEEGEGQQRQGRGETLKSGARLSLGQQ